ncbi:UDP-N-acetylglucosamine--N-acetylmuramyl-(pentapeptide) pyrophosphoryl-undecaprenol N-acetylglucosamine transferase [uncultured archaeon]|nr:UDP-N-acetylglucosamine--N-acetylmuramyl-(pentapeptide) pyrophosphoryl-undecaprenol N-acetylglucosamine transferase [uncultured archaeon]
MNEKKNPKVCIAANGGGHLTEVLQIRKAWENKEHFYICDRRVNSEGLARKERVYFITPARRNPIKFLSGFFKTLRILLKENPKVIISTGADAAFPAILLGALLGKKVIYIETFARISSPSMSGKLAYLFVKDFYVQWPEAKKWFPRAKYAGSVFE